MPDLRQTGGELWFFVHGEQSVRLETIAICIAVTMPS